MKKNQTYFLKDIIEAVKSEKLDDDFCLYDKDKGRLNFQDSYLLADYPQVVDDRDIHPKQVREQRLDQIYMVKILRMFSNQSWSRNQKRLMKSACRLCFTIMSMMTF